MLRLRILIFLLPNYIESGFNDIFLILLRITTVYLIEISLEIDFISLIVVVDKIPFQF